MSLPRLEETMTESHTQRDKLKEREKKLTACDAALSKSRRKRQ